MTKPKPKAKIRKAKIKSYYLRFPARLHSALAGQAKRNRRSLAQEIIFRLERGLARSAAR
ncbi:MAG: hypothetical protein HY748_14390 [Elusimicrobia bacterium]|nr:hypothetical protein [Elusimicrobiota bacterium]